MESEWAELVEQATAWQHQLEEAEAGLTRLEHELNTIDSKLEGLEAESTAWCLPPSLDSAKAELEELETAMLGLRELQGQVIFLKVIKIPSAPRWTQREQPQADCRRPWRETPRCVRWREGSPRFKTPRLRGDPSWWCCR